MFDAEVKHLMAAKPVILQTPELAKLLSASRFTLNRLMLRLKIETSFGTRGRGSRLLFTLEDAVKLAIAYWLFRSGMRTNAIADVLGDRNVQNLCAAVASIEDLESASAKTEFLITWRLAKGQKGWQDVRLASDIDEVKDVLATVQEHGFVVVPLGRLLANFARSIASKGRAKK